jgi:uncharacterized membrane protein YphA (DoxX/SURF4 family)
LTNPNDYFVLRKTYKVLETLWVLGIALIFLAVSLGSAFFRCFAGIMPMRNTVTVLRLLVGVLFVFSGLVKANDPLGLAYKMEEYFAVWHWEWANAFSLGLSLAMNVLEIVSGVALVLGLWPKANTRLLIVLMLFFTFLTGYAVLSGRIKTCGCFGDCLPLQAWQSFLKDLVLLALVLLLAWQYKHIVPWLPKAPAVTALAMSAIVVAYGQYRVLQHLPVIDCLPYAKGKNLLTQMQPPPGSRPDSTVVYYRYTKASQAVSFDASHFPADFNDSLYQFVGRETVVVRKGNADAAIKDFALYSRSGTDTTTAMLQQSGPYLLYFARNFAPLSPNDLEQFTKLILKARQKSLPFFVVSNQAAAAHQWLNHTHHFGVPVLTCDGTVMKTMLRHHTGLVAMQGAAVANKWSRPDLNDAIGFINNASLEPR